MKDAISNPRKAHFQEKTPPSRLREPSVASKK